MKLELINKSRHFNIYQICLIALLLVGFWFLLTYNIGINLWDEGYLWDNSQKTFEKAVPIRDFRSYDPGRYYWVAIFFYLFKPGLFSLQLLLAVLQFVGLFAGLLTINRVIKNFWGLLLSGVIIYFWMIPRYKIFEISLVLVALLTAVWMIEKHDRWRYFVAGLVVGTAAFYAKNFGFYFGLGYFTLILYLETKLSWRIKLEKLGIWLGGILTGYFPMILMFIFCQHFFSSFMDANFRVFSENSIVKPLPIPWPWNFNFFSQTGNFLLGLGYVAMFLYFLAGVTIHIKYKQYCHPLFTASVFIGLPVLGHALTRSDFEHFTISIYPFLIGLLAGYPFQIFTKWKMSLRWVNFFLLGVLCWCLYIFSSEIKLGLEKAKILINSPSQLEKFEFQGGTVWLQRSTVRYLHDLETCYIDKLSNNEDFYVAPYEAGLYPIFQQRSPVWDAFPIHFETVEKQIEQINQLNEHHVHWALISSTPLDGNPSYTFSITHPLIWDYLINNFKPVDCTGLHKDQILFHIKS